MQANKNNHTSELHIIYSVTNEYLQALQQTDVPDKINNLKQKVFSDVIDNEGNQYVDLVQEGGGVLGIALVGYTYVLEQAGIRFFNLAGTSAGAINTIFLAGLGKLNEAKSEKILRILADKDLFDLVDGDPSMRWLIQKFVSKAPLKVVYFLFNLIDIIRILKKKLGFNPGKHIKDWISNELDAEGIQTIRDIELLRKKLPKGMRLRNGEPLPTAKAKLAIIASEISTHTKVEFPRMAPLYWIDPDVVKPGEIIRASMSIPFFFEPYEVKGLPHDELDPLPPVSKSYKELWQEYAGYSGPIPTNAKFVDGGMLSNFPINIFHRTDNLAPTRPTFGVRLSTYRESYSKIDSLFSFSGAMISTMRQIYDYDFILRNPDYKQLICRIDADKDFNWLDFDMKKEDRIRLFVLGAQKAVEFLENFNWQQYKDGRTYKTSKSVIMLPSNGKKSAYSITG
jgi:NTE family protein